MTQVNTGAAQHSCTSSRAKRKGEPRDHGGGLTVSWLDVFIKGNDSSYFFIYYPT